MKFYVKLLKRYRKLEFKFYRFCSNNNGFGMNELLGIAAALILAAFIIIPGLKLFAGNIMAGLTSWWNNSILKVIFPT